MQVSIEKFLTELGLVEGNLTLEVIRTVLENHKASPEVFGGNWSRADIIGSFEDSDEYEGQEELTEEEIDIIIENIIRTHDASIGINWDVIEENISFIIEQRNS